MAFTFNCVQKDTAQNSYVCDAEASDYFDGDPRQDVWAALSTEEQQQHLVASTNRLEMELYGGQVTDDAQNLQWPRSFIADRNGGFHDADTTPREMQVATYELAWWIFEEITEVPLVSRNDMTRMTEYTVGPLSVKMHKVKEAELPDIVKRSLNSIGGDAWQGSGNFGQIKLVR